MCRTFLQVKGELFEKQVLFLELYKVRLKFDTKMLQYSKIDTIINYRV